ncbi:MAG: type I secretion C-terminal target domain-containing protein, partial [Verrucomicrobia bacterium]|nr:type I secretion C-terminal target domain-containing protein [Verrucomicrobiota bacterium]
PVEISDFAVGATGDVLDYSDLLRNASLTYNGSNPFASGYLKLTQRHHSVAANLGRAQKCTGQSTRGRKL